jgi:DNA-binding Xre family transcriptional regulator
MRIYNIKTLTPNKELVQKTGCSLQALKKIVSKGEGAYFSSGSRPNQTAQSWGLARLASSITSGKSAAVDYDILEKGCNHNKKAFLLAKKSRKKYKYGHSSTRKRVVKMN